MSCCYCGKENDCCEMKRFEEKNGDNVFLQQIRLIHNNTTKLIEYKKEKE